MPTSSNSKELAKLLVLLEADEEESDRVPNTALKRLARLHEEAKATVADPRPQVGSENPIGAKIFRALMKRRAEEH